MGKAKTALVIDNEPVDETTKYLLDMITRFRAVFAELPIEVFLNPSSDQISYTVTVAGYHLDNAQGDYVGLDGITKGYQEIVLIVESFNSGRPEKKKFVVERFNLATMIAALRRYGPAQTYGSREHDNYLHDDRALDMLKALKVVTASCGDDMHEPDNQGVEGFVMANYFNKSDDVQRPSPMVRIVKDNALGVDVYVDDLFYLMGNIRRV